MALKPSLSLEDFIVICTIGNPSDFAWGLTADAVGIWRHVPERPELLTQGELLAIRPPNGFGEPILRFPCTFQEMAEFLGWAGMEEYLDSLDEYTRAIQHTSKKSNLPDRSLGVVRRSRSKAPITKVLEYLLDSYPELQENADIELVYKLLKKELKSEKAAIEGQPVAFFVDEVRSTGTARGILMQHPIEGRNPENKGKKFATYGGKFETNGRKFETQADRFLSHARVMERLAKVKKRLTAKTDPATY